MLVAILSWLEIFLALTVAFLLHVVVRDMVVMVIALSTVELPVIDVVAATVFAVALLALNMEKMVEFCYFKSRWSSSIDDVVVMLPLLPLILLFLAQRAISSSYGLLCRKQTSTTVILSPPRPPIWQSGARQWFISSSQISSGYIPMPIRFRQKSTTSLLLITSHMPSHASTMNSQSADISRVSTSGYAVSMNEYWVKGEVHKQQCLNKKS